MTVARMVRFYKVASTPTLARSGLREMEDKDVKPVFDLFTRYMQRFDMVPVMTEEEVRHQFLSGKGKGEKDALNRREGQVVWTYVVEVTTLSLQHISFAHTYDDGFRRTQRPIKSPISSRSIVFLRRS